MNLADYLSELLGQHEEVSVPGLGYFVRVRVNAHYNDKESKFYPPYHQVKFVAQPKDDDTFAQYIADKKNISLASSKYFAEKFISKLKEEAARGKYLFADLGAFQVEQDQLVFKPNNKIPADPAFYGYPQVSIYRLGQPIPGEQVKPAFPEPASIPVTSQPPVQTIPRQQYYEEEVESKKSVNIWLIILIVLAVLALGAFGVYKFYPEAFDKVKSIYHKITGKEETAQTAYQVGTKTDARKESVAKTTVVTPTDTVKTSRWEVIENSYQKLPWANAEVRRLKNLGVAAWVVTDAGGPLLKVSVGTYKTFRQADSARQALMSANKISRNSKEPLEIKPQ